jgi:hypothetical protein
LALGEVVLHPAALRRAAIIWATLPRMERGKQWARRSQAEMHRNGLKGWDLLGSLLWLHL